MKAGNRAVLGWIALLMVLVTTLPAHAATVDVLACDTKAEVTYSVGAGGVINWTLLPPNSGGLGSCSYKGGTLVFQQLQGSGTSHGLGLCTGNPLVTDFTMSVTYRVDGDVPDPNVGQVHYTLAVVNQQFTGLPSVYPKSMAFTTPGFNFPSGNPAMGGGVLTSRIYNMCPPKGSSRAQLVFNVPIYNE